MIRFTPTENAKPKVGDVLLSEPFLDDPYFGRKAVLLCEHNKDGAFGLVLNNFVDVKIADIIKDLKEDKSRVSIGGPVNNSNLYYLHTCDSIKDCQKVADGIYLGGDFDDLTAQIKSGFTSYRFFIGYSGWSNSQLADEIRSRSWFVTRASTEEIMSTEGENEEFWKQLIRGMGPGYTHIAESPSDPTLN
jgi:putative transcriptional regulator